jgi:cAMP-binding proteins - catabolite gene activator and regulatory subunit of cAMP-dependent protein kinases
MRFLRQVALFRHLNDYQLAIINNMCTRESYFAGHVLFREGDPGSVFYMVISGSVKIYTSNAEGQEKILSIMKAGDSFGELALIDQEPRSASAQVMEDAVLYALRRDHFLSLLKANFEITVGIMKELSARLRETNRQVHDLVFLDERSRITKSLVKIAARDGQRDGQQIYFRVGLNYDELAQLAGVKKDTLLQVLREFQDRKVLQISSDHFVLDLSRIL